MKFKKLITIGSLLALAACSKDVKIDVKQYSVSTSNAVLMSRIDKSTPVGDPVRLMKTSGACSFLGKLTQNFEIQVSMIECSNKVTVNRKVDFSIPLSRAHTFQDLTGQMAPGYDIGSKFNVPDAGINWEKLYAQLQSEAVKQ